MKAEEKKTEPADAYLEKIREFVSNTRFGSLTLIIQDGRVIQIEKTEKIRL